MTYNAKHRNIIGTLGFFALGVQIGGVASAIAVLREWLQYKQNGALESNDVMRYVISASAGAVMQFVVLLIVILAKI